MLLDDRVDEVGRFYFDRGIWAFGEAVGNRLDAVSSETRDPVIARSRREREWARLMGDDMATSAAGFRDIGDGVSSHARVVGAPDEPFEDGEMALSESELHGNYW